MNEMCSRFSVLIPALLLSYAAISNAEERKLYEWTVYTKPSVDNVNVVYVGDRLIEHGHGEWKDCLTPQRDLSRKQGLSSGDYRAAVPICKNQPKDKLYNPTYDNAWANGKPTARNGVQISKKNEKYQICQRVMGFRSYCVKDLSLSEIKLGDVFIYSDNSTQQSIEYVGRAGDTLSFIYVEFAGGFARETLNRAFTFDLAGGSVMAYKGAVIEILDATNAQIEYRIVRSFPTNLRND